jgi:uncharacterized protein (DUF58 family)
MLAPAPRLLLASAVIALPLAAVGGMYPGALPVCALALAACASAAALDAFLGFRRISGIALSTPPFIRLTKDMPAMFSVTIANRGESLCELRLGVNLPPGVETESFVLDTSAPPGASAVEWPCAGRTRGDHPLREMHVETVSPLRLWLVREPRPLEFSFRVYPNLRDRASAALFLRTPSAGMRTRRQVGKGREFENLRHYLPGDSFEDIDWKATARRGFPAVKLYRVEQAQEVYAILDFSRLSAREGILESFVEAALHLALVAEKQGDRFGLVTFSHRTRNFVRARSGADHFRLCRETIYDLQAQRVSPDFRDVFTSLQLSLRRRSLLVFFTSLDDVLLAESFKRDISLLSRRHPVLVNVRSTAALQPLYAGEPAKDVDDLYAHLGGQMLWNKMRTLKISLENLGVKLTVTDPEHIKTQAAEGYLEIKRRQIL